MSDKKRAEFELFWQKKILDAGWTLNKTESYFVWKRAWSAAIASVVVELPESYGIGEVYLPAMLRALDEAGVKYE